MGSTFWFTARLARNTTSKVIIEPLDLDFESILRSRHHGRRILIVDDEPLNLDIAQFVLREVGGGC